jgi:hypothetical protein
MRHLNRAAIKEHALECSKKCKNGKFKRVGSDFIDEVEAEIEAVVRKISASEPKPGVFPTVQTELKFATGELAGTVRDRLNDLIARVVQHKVERQPSIGQTLMRVN